jgi:energy-coupling factor transport system substrate-specific component
MMPMTDFLSMPKNHHHFSLRDLLIVTLLAALGIATKPMLQPVARLLLNAFFIPGGVFFGGLYMMWLALARGLVEKPGGGILAAFIQGMTALLLGLSPANGILTLAMYLLPGAAVELAFRLPGRGTLARASRFLLSTVLANLSGIVIVASIRGFSRQPVIILLMIGGLSGALGGLMAFAVSEKIPPRFLKPSGARRRT